MSNYRSQAQNEAPLTKIGSWDDAIADAKQRLRDIEFALQVFEERKKKGDPWPLDGEQQKAPAEAGAEMGEK